MGVGTAIGAGIQGVQAINSGIQGKQAGQRLDNQINQTNQTFNEMVQQGGRAMQNVLNLGQQFQTPDGLPGTILERAQGLGGQLTQNVQNALNPANGADLARNAAQNAFNFSPVQSHLEQTSALAQQMGDTARTQARDQAALAMSQAGGALDSAMAARGFSRNSGAAAAGMANMLQQQALGMSQLEGQLANQAGQMALQGAQMDTQNQLALANMASSHQLGMNQLGANVGLGLQQGALQGAGLLNDAALQGFNALQGTYQQNYLAPQLQVGSMLAGLGGQLAGIGASGLAGNTGVMAEGVKTAGSGKGAATGGLVNTVSGIPPKANAPGVGGGGTQYLTMQ